MNIGNILKTADAIENAVVPDLGFNMSGWLLRGARDRSERSCGTVACIAGWACVLDGVPYAEIGKQGFAFDRGSELFGLTMGEAEELFTPEGDVNYYQTPIGPKHAVRCLRNLAITGKVDWEAAMKGDEPQLPSLPVSKALVRTA